MRQAMLLIILLSLVACNSAGPSGQMGNDNSRDEEIAKIVNQFDSNKYISQVLLELPKFELKAFAQYLKSNEDNEILQKLKFKAGLEYYLSALDNLNKLRGGARQELTKTEIEDQAKELSNVMSKVEELAYTYRQEHVPNVANPDPMDLMPFGMDYAKESFSSQSNYNCFRFYNNFAGLVDEARKSIDELILLNNNTSYAGVDSFRGGPMELVQKNSFSEHFSHWYKTGALTDEKRREQNLLMHQARLDAIDVLLRTYIVYSVQHNEGGGGIGEQSCTSSPEEKGKWVDEIRKLALNLNAFYTGYFGPQSIKSRGDTLNRVAEHAKDKMDWENDKYLTVNVVLTALPFAISARVLGGFVHFGQSLLKGAGGKVAADMTRKTAWRELSIRMRYGASRIGFAKSFTEFWEASKLFGLLSARGLGMFSYRAGFNYFDDMFKAFKGQYDSMRFRRFMMVMAPPGTISTALYLYAEEKALDKVDPNYETMLQRYNAKKDYALIEDELKIGGDGQILRPIMNDEWIDYNRAVETFLDSHVQSPKVYLKLMSDKYSYLNEIDFQRLEVIYGVFPNIKEDIRRHGDIDKTIDYYLNLNLELAEELGMPSAS